MTVTFLLLPGACPARCFAYVVFSFRLLSVICDSRTVTFDMSEFFTTITFRPRLVPEFCSHSILTFFAV